MSEHMIATFIACISASCVFTGKFCHLKGMIQLQSAIDFRFDFIAYVRLKSLLPVPLHYIIRIVRASKAF